MPRVRKVRVKDVPAAEVAIVIAGVAVAVGRVAVLAAVREVTAVDIPAAVAAAAEGRNLTPGRWEEIT